MGGMVGFPACTRNQFPASAGEVPSCRRAALRDGAGRKRVQRWPVEGWLLRTDGATHGRHAEAVAISGFESGGAPVGASLSVPLSSKDFPWRESATRCWSEVAASIDRESTSCTGRSGAPCCNMLLTLTLPPALKWPRRSVCYRHALLHTLQSPRARAALRTRAAFLSDGLAVSGAQQNDLRPRRQ